MRPTNYQLSEAKRLGLSFELSCAENAENQRIQAAARITRAENIRRTALASQQPSEAEANMIRCNDRWDYARQDCG